MLTGTVKFYNDAKGFGFIIADGTGEEIFVHHTGLIHEIQDGDRVRATASRLGAGHLGLAADVTDSEALTAAVAETVRQFGGIDVVIANAAVLSWQTVAATDVDVFAKTIDVNVTGVFRTVRAALPHVMDSKGYVLVVSSLASIVPTPGASAYGASKSAVEAFANALRLEMQPHGVAVGCAHLTFVKTDFVADITAESSSVDGWLNGPLGRLLRSQTAEQVADAFVDAIRRRERRLYVPRAGFVLQWLRPALYSTVTDVLLSSIGRGAVDGYLNVINAMRSTAPARVHAQLGTSTVEPDNDGRQSVQTAKGRAS